MVQQVQKVDKGTLDLQRANLMNGVFFTEKKKTKTNNINKFQSITSGEFTPKVVTSICFNVQNSFYVQKL